MPVTFHKMHGLGNDFVLLDLRAQEFHVDADTATRLAERRTGIGCDQVLVLNDPTAQNQLASFEIWNADGSRAEQCGNGVRCVARMLAGADSSHRSMLLEGPAGLVEATVREDGLVSVNMGAPEFEPGRIPFVADQRQDRYELEACGRVHLVSVVSMGNPHCVLLVDSIAAADVDRLGPAIEEHPRFPEGVNVGFLCTEDRSNVELRVWERGVGETLACGTGACAAVVSGRVLGLLDDEVAVRLPGGQLMVSWHGAAEPVWLSGNAEMMSEGTIDL